MLCDLNFFCWDRHQAQRVLEDHEDRLRLERTTEPGRFSGSGSKSNSTQRRMARPPGNRSMSTDGSATIEFKPVQVKPMEGSVSRIRAAKDMSRSVQQVRRESGSLSRSPGASSPGANTSGLPHVVSGKDVGEGALLPPSRFHNLQDPLLELLNKVMWDIALPFPSIIVIVDRFHVWMSPSNKRQRVLRVWTLFSRMRG